MIRYEIETVAKAGALHHGVALFVSGIYRLISAIRFLHCRNVDFIVECTVELLDLVAL